MILVNPDANSNRDLPNFALAYAATHFNARVVDYNTMPNPGERLFSQETDVLGISFQSRSYTTANAIKNKYLLTFPNASVKSLKGSIDVQCCYPNLNFEDDNNPLIFEKDFSDDYPFPDYSLFDSFSVFQKNWKNGSWPYPIMTSLGCPFSCTYCMSRNRKWYSRSAQNCYEEIVQAREMWKIRTFSIADDCFNLKKKRVLEFCDLVRPLGMEWLCTNGLRADCFDEEMAKAMSESGCTTIGFGIESSRPEILSIIKKGETIDQINQAIEIAKRYFISVSGYLIIGLPGSSYSIDLQSIKWGLKKSIYMHFNMYTPHDNKKGMDITFYGENAKPQSTAYSKKKQLKLYLFTRGLSWGGVNRKTIAVIKNRIQLLFSFGPYLFSRYCLLDLKKLRNKLRRLYL